MSNKDKIVHENKDNNQKKKYEIGCGDIVNDFIEDVWTVMTPEMIDRLKCVLQEDLGMSKKDVDKFIASQRDIRRKRICLKKNQRVVRIGLRNQWIKELAKDISDQMASFIVGTIIYNRSERTKRITESVLQHLCEITGENTTLESAKSRIERSLVVVSDRMAKWINEAISDIEKELECCMFKKVSTAALESSTEGSTIQSDLSSDVESKSKLSLLSITSDEEESKMRGKKEKKKKRGSKMDDESETDDGSVTVEFSSSEDEKESDEEGKTESEIDESESEEGEEEEEVEEDEDIEEEEETVEEEVEEESVVEEDIEEEEISEEDEPEDEEDIDEEEISEESEAEKVSTIVETEVKGETEGEEEDEEVVNETESFLFNEEAEPFKEETVLSSESIIEVEKKLLGDILDLLKEDIGRISNAEEKTERQKAMKEVIDKRLEKIAKEKLEQSLDSLVKYDIDEAASIVATWVEKILAAADSLQVVPSDFTHQGPAFEVKRLGGSQYQVQKVSSTSVAQKVAETRGISHLLRKKNIPRTMSPMNLKSGKDWADWALGAANVGDEWGKWLDTLLTEADNQMLTDKPVKSHGESVEDWRTWRDLRAREAQKWRVERQKISNEGKLWNRKLEGPNKQRSEIMTSINL